MITVNSDPLPWHDGMTVAEILKIRNYIFRMIAVQVNGELVRRGTYDKAEALKKEMATRPPEIK